MCFSKNFAGSMILLSIEAPPSSSLSLLRKLSMDIPENFEGLDFLLSLLSICPLSSLLSNMNLSSSKSSIQF